jgi:hypothetical protein
MPRMAICTTILLLAVRLAAFGQKADVERRMVYTPSHRATYEQQWKFTFPKHKSKRWIIALRYPPELPWSRDAVGEAELRTSAGWKPFREVVDKSKERRRMLLIDYAHDDPMLRKGFVVRTRLTATICDQRLEQGGSARAVPSLPPGARQKWLEHTNTYDFRASNVKQWMDKHQMWRRKDETALNFVHRVYKQLRVHMPYSTRDGGPWICSQILKVGFGECCRHSIVTTSILRANKIPARTVCGVWAIDNKSTGGHCWGEFFLEGAGWVPYDTTLGDDKKSEAYFGTKKGEVLAGMVDFDWVIETGPFKRKTVFAIDAEPFFWSQGEGPMDNPKSETHTSVRILQHFSNGQHKASNP